MSTGGTQLAGITTASMERSVIETKGPIGKWHSMVKVAAGTTVEFTSSFTATDPGAGYSGVLLAHDTAATSEVWVNGSAISTEDLSTGVIYDLDLTRVKAVTGPIYVFKKGS